MRIRILIAAVLFLSAGSACPGEDARQSILILGDSLSAAYGVQTERSWVTLLENQLTAEGYGYRVVNASISGDTTSGGLRRLPRALERHSPGIVLIELGGNDGLRGTPIDVIRDNLASMIDLSRASGARVILAGMEMPPNYGGGYTRKFASIYRELAREYGIDLIGFFMENVALNPKLMQADGIHPNADGQPELLNNVWPVLQNLLARTDR